jgi:NAD(P)-dependent dehydrogenase (short-subunit alcohol dehydrogenase family)
MTLGKKQDCDFDSDPRQNKELAESLRDKHVLIAGAGRGIGRATAEMFAYTAISSLSILALELNEVNETARLCSAINPNLAVRAAAVDVTDFVAVQQFVDKTAHEFGRIDVVFMNAGRPPQFLSVHESEASIWWDTVTISLQGSFNLSRAVLPLMRQSSSGGTFIMTSSAGAHVTEGMGSYTIGKLGVSRLAEILHHENKQAGIRAFSLHPGVVRTRFYTDFEEVVEGKVGAATSYASKDVPGDEESAKAAVNFFKDKPFDTIQMPAGMVVLLASGRLDFLSGRYVDSSITLAEYLADKDRILEEDAYRIKLIVGKDKFLPEWKA